jgi:glycosidase
MPQRQQRQRGRPRPTSALPCALLVLLFAACVQSPAEEPAPSRRCAFPAFYKPDATPAHIAVIGAFNQWDTHAHPMTDPDGDGIYQALVNLPPGAWTYQLYVDGRVVNDPYNPLTLFDDGRERSLADLTRCAAPALEITRVETAEGRAEIDAQLLRGASGAPIDPQTVRLRIDAPHTDDTHAQLAVSPEQGLVRVTLEGLAPGRYQLELDADDTQGLSAEHLTLPLWIHPGPQDAPFDWRDALIYQVVLDRFKRGGGEPLQPQRGISSYHGGDLDGLTEAILDGYFDDLAVNVLWISPLYDNPEGEFLGRDGHMAEPYHGYWPQAPRTVEPRFGDEAAVERLVDAAHQRGLRVIMDAVLNHVHTTHPYFQQNRDNAWINNPDGACICGTTCPWSDFIRECWFDPFLADLNWENPEVVQQLTDDALWWLERFHLDGLRIDAVPMMPRLAVRHLRHRVQERLGQGQEHVYLLGETYTSRGGQDEIRRYIGDVALSGQFDYPVMWALRDAIARRIPLDELDAEVQASEDAWDGSGAVMAPIIGNHDVSRFISDINGDVTWRPRDAPPLNPASDEAWARLRLAWTFLLTQPGAPILYYGDEIGMAGGNDPDNRRDMRFDDLTEREAAVRAHVAQLAQARRCSPALRRGLRQTLAVEPDVYAYGRDAGDGRPAVVLINRVDAPRTLTFDLPEAWALDTDAPLRDLFGAPVTLQGRRILATVPPLGSMLLLEPGCTP